MLTHSKYNRITAHVNYAVNKMEKCNRASQNGTALDKWRQVYNANLQYFDAEKVEYIVWTGDRNTKSTYTVTTLGLP